MWVGHVAREYSRAAYFITALSVVVGRGKRGEVLQRFALLVQGEEYLGALLSTWVSPACLEHVCRLNPHAGRIIFCELYTLETMM